MNGACNMRIMVTITPICSTAISEDIVQNIDKSFPLCTTAYPLQIRWFIERRNYVTKKRRQHLNGLPSNMMVISIIYVRIAR